MAKPAAASTGAAAKRRAQVLSNEQYRIRAQLIEKVVVRLITGAWWVAGLYLLAPSLVRGVELLAGQETQVLISAYLETRIAKSGSSLGETASAALPVVASLGVGYGLLERYFRRRKTKELTARIADLERIIDPGRSSSQLMPDGSTRPDDQ